MSQLIALTGATGFIGSTLARQLAADRLRIRALTRPNSSRSLLSGLDIEWVNGDLNDLDSLKTLVQGVHGVVHCAGAVRGATKAQFDTANADGVARLVKAAAGQRPPPRFILVSSLAAREKQLSDYAASKYRGEKLLEAGSAGMPWVALRPPAVYGPGDREMRPLFQWARRGVVPRFAPAGARLSLIYVDDLARALKEFVISPAVRQQIYELHDGHHRGYSINQIADIVAGLYRRRVLRVPVPKILLQTAAVINLTLSRMLGFAPMLTPGKVRELTHRDWTCDNQAIQRAIDWRPRVDLPEGIKRTLA